MVECEGHGRELFAEKGLVPRESLSHAGLVTRGFVCWVSASGGVCGLCAAVRYPVGVNTEDFQPMDHQRASGAGAAAANVAPQVPMTPNSVDVFRLQRLDRDLPMPQRAHRGDAGVDLYATEDLVLQSGERALVGTGIALGLPLGFVGLIHPRSGLALKHGISVVNTPGTIDADYRGEIKVCLINHDLHEPFVVKRGDRIAQLVIQRVELVDFVEVDALDETERGAGGYGSTGVAGAAN